VQHVTQWSRSSSANHPIPKCHQLLCRPVGVLLVAGVLLLVLSMCHTGRFLLMRHQVMHPWPSLVCAVVLTALPVCACIPPSSGADWATAFTPKQRHRPGPFLWLLILLAAGG
jgi:hypothetical protein